MRSTAFKKRTQYRAPKKLNIAIVHDGSLASEGAKLIRKLAVTEGSEVEPVPIADETGRKFYGDNCWAYRDKVFCVEGANLVSEEELKLRIKHECAKHSAELQRLRREVEAFENLDKISSARRERIPEAVRMFVWQRDGGRCLECGTKESLEFDHIIPVVEGGATTERNIQLLCEPCNRRKGRKV
jgi:hypothetical protein